jgi:uncharacterized membrane protein YedE/YeeE
MIAEFDPLSGFIGGVLIGLATLILLIGNGRIAGISGILGNLFASITDVAWRVAFLIGIIAGPLIWLLVRGGDYPITVTNSLPLLIAGGILVGFGTRMGSGCTSGHGVCGLGRFSPRSLVATCIFMAVAAVTVFIIRHVIGGAA